MTGSFSAPLAILSALLASPTASSPAASIAACAVVAVQSIGIGPSLILSVVSLPKSSSLVELVSSSHFHGWHELSSALSAGPYSPSTVGPCVSDVVCLARQVAMPTSQRDSAHCELANFTAKFNTIKHQKRRAVLGS